MCAKPILTKSPRHFLLSLFVLYSFINSHAQKPVYTYQDLSRLAYANQKDSLKRTWTCPVLYKEKPTQKKYKELWDSRTEFITSAIDEQQYVFEKEIYSYLNQILDQLMIANPKIIKSKPLLLLDRSSSVNAYAIGGNIIAVNMGLLNFSTSREETALVLAHELSHNILDHPGHSMKEQAEWLTSKEYENSLKEILNSKYERYTRLKKVFEGYSLSSSKHHRYHESDADSLAIILLKNSHIGFDARFFLRLDSTDLQYKIPLKYSIEDYFKKYGLVVENAWTQKRSKGLSSKNYNFSDTTQLDDSLKTHPDCAVRYAKTLPQSDNNIQLTPIPASIKEKTNKIIIWNLFENAGMTAVLYRILQEKDRNNKDEWYDFMLANVIAGLHHADRTLNRFNAISIKPKEYVSKSYYELQNILEQMPKENLEQYYTSFQALNFWQKMPDDAKGLKLLLASIVAEGEAEKSTRKIAQEFMNTYKESMYCEFANHFTGK